MVFDGEAGAVVAPVIFGLALEGAFLAGADLVDFAVVLGAVFWRGDLDLADVLGVLLADDVAEVVATI